MIIEIVVDVLVLLLFVWLSSKDDDKYKDKPLGYKTFVLASINIVFILYSQYQLIADLEKLL